MRWFAPIGEVENQLHWHLDVSMNHDQDRTVLDNGPHDLAVLRRMALSVLQKDTMKELPRSKFMRASWHDRYLAWLLVLFCNAIALRLNPVHEAQLASAGGRC